MKVYFVCSSYCHTTGMNEEHEDEDVTQINGL